MVIAALFTAALAQKLPGVHRERMRLVHVLWSTAQQWEGTNYWCRAQHEDPRKLMFVGKRVHTVGFYLYQVLEQVKAICARDYPGGPVVKNPPCNAGDLGSIRGWGTKIPHATEQLSLHVATRGSTHHNERSRMT